MSACPAESVELWLKLRGGGLESGPDNSSVAVCLRDSHQPQLRVRAGSGITVECEWGVPGAV